MSRSSSHIICMQVKHTALKVDKCQRNKSIKAVGGGMSAHTPVIPATVSESFAGVKAPPSMAFDQVGCVPYRMASRTSTAFSDGEGLLP